GAVPAGCTFWREAMNGKSFYTVPSDHYNCAVGSHTHAIPQPADRAGVLNDTVGYMVSQGYIEMAEVPGIPTLTQMPNYIAYGPVETVAFRPDVVLEDGAMGRAAVPSAKRSSASTTLRGVVPSSRTVSTAFSTRFGGSWASGASSSASNSPDVLAANLGLPRTVAEALPKERLFIARPPDAR
ncbi:hypothetical protein B4Q13_22000, partial [Lacticaseibacillus rhamnosus]